jgi:hypothetical protein
MECADQECYSVFTHTVHLSLLLQANYLEISRRVCFDVVVTHGSAFGRHTYKVVDIFIAKPSHED